MTLPKLPWSVGVLAVGTLLLGGCGTLTNLSNDAGPRIYGGVAVDVDQAIDSYEHASNAVIYFAGLLAWCVDTPISAVGDTLTLPYVIPASLGWMGHRAPAPPVLDTPVDFPH